MSKFRGLAVIFIAIAILAFITSYRTSMLHQGEAIGQKLAERCAKPVLEHFHQSATCLGYVPDNVFISAPR